MGESSIAFSGVNAGVSARHFPAHRHHLSLHQDCPAIIFLSGMVGERGDVVINAILTENFALHEAFPSSPETQVFTL